MPGKKNTGGGKGHKRQASKHTNTVPTHTQLRVKDDPSTQYYANVLQFYGGQHFKVKCDDGIERFCYMERKFCNARAKYDNLIKPDVWVLVAVDPSFTVSTSANKLPKCQLLEVYTDHDKINLKKIQGISWHHLASTNSISSCNGQTSNDDDDFVFSMDDGTGSVEYYQGIMKALEQKKINVISTSTISTDPLLHSKNEIIQEEEINVDDI